MSRPRRPDRVGEPITTRRTGFALTTAAHELVSRFVEAAQQAAWPRLLEGLALEAPVRHERRIARLRRASKLPPGKTFDTLKDARVPPALVRRFHELAEGDVVDEATTVLAFGLPSVGKSHAMCAVAHVLVERGRSVLFVRLVHHSAILAFDVLGDRAEEAESWGKKRASRQGEATP